MLGSGDLLQTAERLMEAFGWLVVPVIGVRLTLTFLRRVSI